MRPTREAWRLARAAVVAAALAALPLAGCGDLLEVPDPDVATPGSVQNEASLPVVLAGALGDFQVAYGGYQGGGGGSGEGQILVSGLLADELRHTGTFETRQQIDLRSIRLDNSLLEQVFRELERARASAVRASDLFQQFQPDSAGHALALALEGYTYIFSAENYCSGVPVSTLTESGELQFGAPLPTDSLLNRAIDRFQRALTIAQTANDADLASLARVGWARAQLDLGDMAGAAQTAAPVPTSFEFLIEHSVNTTRQNNGVWYMNINAGRYSAVTNEDVNGLDFLQTPPDPRVPWQVGTRAPFDQTLNIPLLFQLKYPDRASPTVLADGIEARLIQAEAALAKGQSAAYLPTLNTLRATVGLAPLPDPGTPAARVNQFFRERAFWLYLTSHRLGDLRRLVRQYGRSAASVFPTGEYYRPGLQYGTDVNLPVPEVEQNNPLFQACLDRNA
jgi:hypothetical protein